MCVVENNKSKKNVSERRRCVLTFDYWHQHCWNMRSPPIHLLQEHNPLCCVSTCLIFVDERRWTPIIIKLCVCYDWKLMFCQNRWQFVSLGSSWKRMQDLPLIGLTGSVPACWSKSFVVILSDAYCVSLSNPSLHTVSIVAWCVLTPVDHSQCNLCPQIIATE